MLLVPEVPLVVLPVVVLSPDGTVAEDPDDVEPFLLGEGVSLAPVSVDALEDGLDWLLVAVAEDGLDGDGVVDDLPGSDAFPGSDVWVSAGVSVATEALVEEELDDLVVDWVLAVDLVLTGSPPVAARHE
jgi:hypothetical protein